MLVVTNRGRLTRRRLLPCPLLMVRTTSSRSRRTVNFESIRTSWIPSRQANEVRIPNLGNNQLQALSPGPVTAGPEFGRQNVGIIDMPMNEVRQSPQCSRHDTNCHSFAQRMKSAQSTNPRHSFNGSEVGVNFNQQPRNVSGGSSSPFGILGEAASGTPGGGHGHGHSRSGSAGNWGSFSQKPHFAAASPYAHTPSPGNDLGVAGTGGSPWGSQDFSAGVSRLGERTWAT